MDPIQALDTTSQHFIALVGQVSAEQWDKPTPCEQWNVRSLVGHVITSTQGYAELLHGAPASRLAELGKHKSTIGGNDVPTAVIHAAAQARAAFAEPGVLERTVHHPMGDLPGSQLLWFRIVDNVLHGWDLATAVCLPAEIDGALAEDLYQGLLPMADALRRSGYFAPPRTSPGSGAGPQEQLLTLVGR